MANAKNDTTPAIDLDAAAKALAIVQAKEARAAELAAKRADARTKLEGETKGDAFKRIAIRRVNNALGEMNTLMGLANKNNYDYSPAQANAILASLTAKLAEVKAAFEGEAKAKGGFSF